MFVLIKIICRLHADKKKYLLQDFKKNICSFLKVSINVWRYNRLHSGFFTGWFWKMNKATVCEASLSLMLSRMVFFSLISFQKAKFWIMCPNFFLFVFFKLPLIHSMNPQTLLSVGEVLLCSWVENKVHPLISIWLTLILKFYLGNKKKKSALCYSECHGMACSWVKCLIFV